MGKDFDTERAEVEQRDRTFTLAGREFKFRLGVRPEALIEYSDFVTGRLQLDERDAIAMLDRTMSEYLEPEYHSVWKEAREDTTIAHPITSDDIFRVIGYMTEVLTVRPTKASSDSSSGDESTGTTSTDDSPAPVGDF